MSPAIVELIILAIAALIILVAGTESRPMKVSIGIGGIAFLIHELVLVAKILLGSGN